MRGWARRLGVFAIATSLASAALYTGACAPDDAGSAPSGAIVIYEGGATDEGLRALEAEAPEVNAAQAAIFDAPEEGAALPASLPATLRWHIRDPLGRRGEPRKGARSARAALWGLLGPARAAHAHGAPMNGRGYLLTISGPDGEALARVFTTALYHTPDAATWDTILAAGGPITAVVTNAVFADNQIAPDGGPFAGEPISFTVVR